MLDPLYRGLGLGKQLLQTALEHARKNGFPEARLDTTSDLRRAIGLYEKAGFQKPAKPPGLHGAKGFGYTNFHSSFDRAAQPGD